MERNRRISLAHESFDQTDLSLGYQIVPTSCVDTPHLHPRTLDEVNISFPKCWVGTALYGLGLLLDIAF